MFKVGFTLWVVFGLAMLFGTLWYIQSGSIEESRNLYLRQFENNDSVSVAVRQNNFLRNNGYFLVYGGWLSIGILMLLGKVFHMLKYVGIGLFIALLVFSGGCARPFEPVMLETIGTNEEGFLIPWTGDTKKQTSTNNEEFLRENLVSTKQIRLPQQWVPVGYEWLGPNGTWKPAAVLIRVDKSPVTREWTADENSGTSNRKEAVWVMTSDQVEFSTGWTCTARIASRNDAIKFLHNYPNGSLSYVLDHEVRAKLQADFGLEVTDLNMDELRKNATPHIRAVITKVETFFAERGINITNMGITGGFVYKNPSVQERLVEVFNMEQLKNIAIAKTQAQEQTNKQIQLEADARGRAILTLKQAESAGIKAIADAKAYELTKAKEDLPTYLKLKQIELETKRAEKWNGEFPRTLMSGQTPSLLLQVPGNDNAGK